MCEISLQSCSICAFESWYEWIVFGRVMWMMILIFLVADWLTIVLVVCMASYREWGSTKSRRLVAMVTLWTPASSTASTRTSIGWCFWLVSHFVSSSYPRSPNSCPEAVVDCVGKPWIFIQCSCLIAPLCGYQSALWRTRMLLPNAGRKLADWL